jgi:hypothetical protein
MARSRQTRDQEGLVTVTEDHTEELLRALDELARVQVLIGIPNDAEQPHYGGTGARESTGTARVATAEGPAEINNAVLGYIHEHGSPINNIPPRPWLAPGVEESKSRWLPYMEQAGTAVLTFPSDSSKMDRALHAAGMTAVSAVKTRIVAGIPPALSERTIAARRYRTPSRQARQQADVTPLVDTAQMLNSISYVIKK